MPVMGKEDQASQGFVDRVSQARKELKEASSAYEKGLSRAQAEYNKRISDAQKALSAEEKTLQKTVSAWNSAVRTYAGISLYNDRVVFGGTVMPFTYPVTAHVETSGNVYTSTEVSGKTGGFGVGRAVVGGALFGPVGAVVGGATKKGKVSSTTTTHDERRLFITISSPQGQITAEGKPEEEASARDFVSAVVSYAASYNAKAAAYNGECKRLNDSLSAQKEALRHIETDVSAIEAARKDTAQVDEAKASLEAIMGSGSDDDRSALTAYEKKKKTRLIVAIAGAVILVAVVVVLVLAFN